MPTTTDTTRTVNSRDVERNNVTTAVIPYVQDVDKEDKDSDKVEVKLPNGNKIYLPFITVSRGSTPRVPAKRTFFVREVHRKSIAREGPISTDYSKTEVENRR
jgi:hypothetical protein